MRGRLASVIVICRSQSIHLVSPCTVVCTHIDPNGFVLVLEAFWSLVWIPVQDEVVLILVYLCTHTSKQRSTTCTTLCKSVCNIVLKHIDPNGFVLEAFGVCYGIGYQYKIKQYSYLCVLTALYSHSFTEKKHLYLYSSY